MAHSIHESVVNATDDGLSAAMLIRDTLPGVLADSLNDLLALAVRRHLGTAAEALLAARAALGTSAPPLTATSFEDLVSADLVEAALGLARAEAGTSNLADATADDEDAVDADGERPLRSYLHAAAAAGASERMIQALLAAGCSINQHARYGSTPLHEAAAGGHLATCKALVAAGADALARNGRGRAPKQLPGLSAELKEFLSEAEEAAKRRKREQQEATWGSALQATQTASALRTGCV